MQKYSHCFYEASFKAVFLDEIIGLKTEPLLWNVDITLTTGLFISVTVMNWFQLSGYSSLLIGLYKISKMQKPGQGNPNLRMQMGDLHPFSLSFFAHKYTVKVCVNALIWGPIYFKCQEHYEIA